MTYVEFFVPDAIENISTCLTGNPGRVIFVGENLPLMEKQAMRYRMVLLGRGTDVGFICKKVERNDLRAIIDALSEIIETYGPCIFDLTGGSELYLVATGIVYDRYRDIGVQLHKFSVMENKVIDCDESGRVLTEELTPKFSVEENIRIYGGDIVYENEKAGGTRRYVYTEEFRNEISAVWDISRKDAKRWNRFAGILAIAFTFRKSEDALSVSAPIPELLRELKKAGFKNEPYDEVFRELKEAGLLTDYSAENDVFRFTVKNEEVRHFLTKSGQVLEMAVWAAACGAKSAIGTNTYNDAMTGVMIDWDGNLHKSGRTVDTENEIDVIMMRGLIPVFVSCKNGSVGMDELYKLNTVADRFGGRYAKKVLVTTSLGDSGFASYFRQRAADMKIRLVEQAQEYSLDELEELVDSFRLNGFAR